METITVHSEFSMALKSLPIKILETEQRKCVLLSDSLKVTSVINLYQLCLVFCFKSVRHSQKWIKHLRVSLANIHSPKKKKKSH